MLSLTLLGSFAAAVGDHSLSLPTDKTRALLAYLALAPDTALRRERLAGLLWPDQAEDLARQNLRKTLGRLKQAVGAADPALAGRLLTLTKHTIELRGAECALDVASFAAHLAAANQHPHPALAQCEACRARLEAAVELGRRGELLAGLSLPDAAPFEDWLRLQREHWHQQVLAALQALADAYESLGAYARARQYAQWQIEAEPWREAAHRQLMRLLAAQGQRAEAMAQYQACRRLLLAELGAAPSPETEALLGQIMDGSLPIAAARAAAAPPQPWPQLAGPLIGREADREQIISRLADPACRVLTLTGLGGVGKTSLALAVGERLRQAPPDWAADGIYFVPLAAISSGTRLPAPLAEALGLALNQRLSLAAQVEQFVRPLALLLILDNFEQLIAEADWLRDLVATAPHLKLLITSREPVSWQGEWRYPLEGLAYPQAEAAGEDFDAVRLFVQAARQVQPGFAYTAADGQAISRICRLVYGWPLALHMAGAWVRVMDCQAIADQIETSLDFLTTTMRDVPPRQRSMRVIFEHTWAALTEAERTTLAQLAVFSGGFSLAAAGAVAGASALVLSGLVDKALVARDERTGRYSLHELLRQFVGEHAAAAGEALRAAQHAHSRYYLHRLQAEAERLSTIEFRATLEALKADQSNLRQAWLWAARSQEYTLLADSLGPMSRFYESSGLPQEAAALFQRSLAALEERRGPPAGLVARLWVHLAESWMTMGQHDEALRAVETAWARARGLDDLELTNQLYFTQALILREQGHYERTHALLGEAKTFNRTRDHLEGVARALHLQGNTYWSMAAYEQARRCYEDSRALYTRLGRATAVGVLTGNIGVVHWRLGQHAEALAHYQVALEAQSTTGDATKTAVWIGNIGLVYVDLNEDERAMAHLDEALAIHVQLGRKFWEIEPLLGKTAVHLRRGELEAAMAAHRRATTLSYEIGNRTYLLDCDLWQARLYAAQGRPAEAASMLRSLREREFRPDAKAAILRELQKVEA